MKRCWKWNNFVFIIFTSEIMLIMKSKLLICETYWKMKHFFTQIRQQNNSWIIFSSFVSLKMKKNCCLMCQEVRESEKESSTMNYYIFTKKKHQEEKKKTFRKRKKNSWEIYLHFCVARAHEKNSHFASCCFFTFFDRFIANFLCTHKKNSSDIMKCSHTASKMELLLHRNLKRIEWIENCDETS